MNNTKEANAKKEEKLAELLREAEGHPMLQALRAEKAAAILETRTEATGKIEAAKKERDEFIPQMIEDRDAKEAKYKAAKAALDTAGGEYYTARSALSSRSQSFDHAISTQEQTLIESADPAIDAAIIFFREKLDWLRKPERISSNMLGGERNIIAEKITVRAESNLDAIHLAMKYCTAAIEELQRMKLSPELDIQKVEAIKNGIPDIQVFTESTGERPMEKVNTDPRSMLPSDSQLDWSLGKLYQKVEKILKK